MKKFRNLLIVPVILLLFFNLCNCSSISSDPFVGEWTQIADLGGQDVPSGTEPITLRISKQDVFYLVETSDSGKYSPYPDKSGRYELAEGSTILVSTAFGSKFSIEYRKSSSTIFENAWFGYFKRKR